MPQTVTATPLFSTGTPGVMNSNNVLTFSLPVFNTGTAPASNVLITGITLGFSTVAAVSLPLVALDSSRKTFTAAVTTSAIDRKNKLVGFQGDFTFDERAVTFGSPPVQNAGLTAGNWSVLGSVLPGKGPIRTFRVSAFANDFAPLSGSGVLFELRLNRISKTSQSTRLDWAASPDNFIFIDADLKNSEAGQR
jgi:hypothetical protein